MNIFVAVAVPCFPPTVCTNCDVKNANVIVPGDSDIIVVTLRGLFFFKQFPYILYIYTLLIGRFDLKAAAFECMNCGWKKDATVEDYVFSDWFPAHPSRSKYFFSKEVLCFWYYLKHNVPSISERKFVETLEETSPLEGRVSYFRFNFVIIIRLLWS